MPTPSVTRPPLSTSSVAICLAMSGMGCIGSTTRFTNTRTRSVSAAAAELMTFISWFWNVMRSPHEMDEYGPSSMPRHQSSVVARV